MLVPNKPYSATPTPLTTVKAAVCHQLADTSSFTFAAASALSDTDRSIAALLHNEPQTIRVPPPGSIPDAAFTDVRVCAMTVGFTDRYHDVEDNARNCVIQGLFDHSAESVSYLQSWSNIDLCRTAVMQWVTVSYGIFTYPYLQNLSLDTQRNAAIQYLVDNVGGGLTVSQWQAKHNGELVPFLVQGSVRFGNRSSELKDRLVKLKNNDTVYYVDFVDEQWVCRVVSGPAMIDGTLLKWEYIQAVDTLPHPVLTSYPLTTPLSDNAARVDKSKWMECCWPVIQHKPLLNLCLPGTHDSGTYKLNETLAEDANSTIESLFDIPTLRGYIKDMAVAQSHSIRQQLDGGIRYLDLRVCSDNDGNFFTCHSLRGDPITRLTQDLRAFLDDHPYEFVVVKYGSKITSKTADAVAAKKKWTPTTPPKSNTEILEQLALDDIASILGDHLWLWDTYGGYNFTTMTPYFIKNVVKKRCIFLRDDAHLFGTYSSACDTLSLMDSNLKLKTELMRVSRGFTSVAVDGGSVALGAQTYRYGVGADRAPYGKKSIPAGTTAVAAPSTFDISDPAPRVLKHLFIDYGTVNPAVGKTTSGNWGWVSAGTANSKVVIPTKTLLGEKPVFRSRNANGDFVEVGCASEDGPFEFSVGAEPQLRVADGRLLEAQLFRPISDMRYVLGFLRSDFTPEVALAAIALMPPPICMIAGVAMPLVLPALIVCKTDSTNPSSLHENAKGSRSIMKSYFSHILLQSSGTAPQLLNCDFYQDTPLVELAIMISCGAMRSPDFSRTVNAITNELNNDGDGPALNAIQGATKGIAELQTFFTKTMPHFFESDVKNFFVKDIGENTENFFKDAGKAIGDVFGF